MVQALALEDGWHYDLASLLSQIGRVALPPGLIGKIVRGEVLTHTEQQQFDGHPAIGARLLKLIPRLELVAEMVSQQRANMDSIDFQGKLDNAQRAALGGQIIKVAIAFDRLLGQELAEKAAIESLKQIPSEYDPLLVESLAIGTQRQWLEVLTLRSTSSSRGRSWTSRCAPPPACC